MNSTDMLDLDHNSFFGHQKICQIVDNHHHWLRKSFHIDDTTPCLDQIFGVVVVSVKVCFLEVEF